MHGVVFGELKQYVAARLGRSAWTGLLDAAALGPRLYLAVLGVPGRGARRHPPCGVAPDRPLHPGAAAGLRRQLVRMYRMYILPEWKALDVIEHTEERIHRMVGLQHKGARPLYLSTTRRCEDEIIVHYSSERRLCALAKGIAIGIARHYRETLTIHLSCMHTGAPTCEILLRAVR